MTQKILEGTKTENWRVGLLAASGRVWKAVFSFTRRNITWLAPLAFFISAALVYLPLVRQFGFFNDDWYLMYDAKVMGPGFFSTVFASDRPARAPLQFVLYILFGEHLLYYHLSAYFFRVCGALALWMSLKLVWPAQKRAGLLASLLFLIYPGFLSQTNAVDFQAHIFSLMLGMVSTTLSLKSFLAEQKWVKWSLAVLALLSGWWSLALMEYFIGMEALRLALLAVLVWRKNLGTYGQLLRKFLSSAWFFTLIPAGFLAWRLFIFQGERRATDLGAQVGQLISSPFSTGFRWMLFLLQDTINVIITAWVVPLYTLAFPLRLRELIPALAIGVITAGLVWVMWRSQDTDQEHWKREAGMVGLAAVLGGLFPVILANRHVNFSDYSRYTIPAMAGAVLILSAVLAQVKSQALRSALVIFLAFTAGMTHYANAVNAAAVAQATRSFWWQAAWRIPDLARGVSLVADYPSIAIQEDYFIWGPANQIYFPQKQIGGQVNVPLNAIVLTPQNSHLINVGRGQDAQLRRGNATLVDYRNVMILTQPASNACLRVIDGKQPELSENDRPEIMLAAPASRTDSILLNSPAKTPPASFFGSEPPHEWCYYYQKASLARQQGNWQKVADLGEKAQADGFYPSDKIEWMPFMQAYTELGQTDKLHRFVSIIAESPFIQKQTCAILSSSTTDPDILNYLRESFCK